MDDASAGVSKCWHLLDHTYALRLSTSPPQLLTFDIDDVSCNTTVVTSAAENENVWEGSVTRCICGFEHDDGFMICCDQCSVWQHVICMGISRTCIPEVYLCERCSPRAIDVLSAVKVQSKARQKLADSDADCESDADFKQKKTAFKKLENRSGSKASETNRTAPKAPEKNVVGFKCSVTNRLPMQVPKTAVQPKEAAVTTQVLPKISKNNLQQQNYVSSMAEKSVLKTEDGSVSTKTQVCDGKRQRQSSVRTSIEQTENLHSVSEDELSPTLPKLTREEKKIQAFMKMFEKLEKTEIGRRESKTIVKTNVSLKSEVKCNKLGKNVCSNSAKESKTSNIMRSEQDKRKDKVEQKCDVTDVTDRVSSNVLEDIGLNKMTKEGGVKGEPLEVIEETNNVMSRKMSLRNSCNAKPMTDTKNKAQEQLDKVTNVTDNEETIHNKQCETGMDTGEPRLEAVIKTEIEMPLISLIGIEDEKLAVERSQKPAATNVCRKKKAVASCKVEAAENNANVDTNNRTVQRLKLISSHNESRMNTRMSCRLSVSSSVSHSTQPHSRPFLKKPLRQKTHITTPHSSGGLSPERPVSSDTSQGHAFAKKRWLMQAISESSVPVTENTLTPQQQPGMSTPLKKRRLTMLNVDSEVFSSPECDNLTSSSNTLIASGSLMLGNLFERLSSTSVTNSVARSPIESLKSGTTNIDDKVANQLLTRLQLGMQSMSSLFYEDLQTPEEPSCSASSVKNVQSGAVTSTIAINEVPQQSCKVAHVHRFENATIVDSTTIDVDDAVMIAGPCTPPEDSTEKEKHELSAEKPNCRLMDSTVSSNNHVKSRGESAEEPESSSVQLPVVNVGLSYSESVDGLKVNAHKSWNQCASSVSSSIKFNSDKLKQRYDESGIERSRSISLSSEVESPLSSSESCNKEDASEDMSLASVKRKMSITEYRHRQQKLKKPESSLPKTTAQYISFAPKSNPPLNSLSSSRTVSATNDLPAQWNCTATAAEQLLDKPLSLIERLRVEFGVDAVEDSEPDEGQPFESPSLELFSQPSSSFDTVNIKLHPFPPPSLDSQPILSPSLSEMLSNPPPPLSFSSFPKPSSLPSSSTVFNKHPLSAKLVNLLGKPLPIPPPLPLSVDLFAEPLPPLPPSPAPPLPPLPSSEGAFFHPLTGRQSPRSPVGLRHSEAQHHSGAWQQEVPVATRNVKSPRDWFHGDGYHGEADGDIRELYRCTRSPDISSNQESQCSLPVSSSSKSQVRPLMSICAVPTQHLSVYQSRVHGSLVPRRTHSSFSHSDATAQDHNRRDDLYRSNRTTHRNRDAAEKTLPRRFSSSYRSPR